MFTLGRETHMNSILTRLGVTAAAACLVTAGATGAASAHGGHGGGKGGHGGHGPGGGAAIGCGVKGGHAVVDGRGGGRGGGKGGHGGSTADLATQQARLTAAITALGTCLDDLTDADALAELSTDDAAAIAANATADHAVLDGLAATVAAATTTDELAAVKSTLAGFRVGTYKLAVKAVGKADALTATIGELSVTHADDADALVDLAAAQTAVDEAKAAALALTASSTRDGVRAVFEAIKAARDLIEPLED